MARGPERVHAVRRLAPAARAYVTFLAEHDGRADPRGRRRAGARAVRRGAMTRTACVVGSGAREHALAHALSRSADVLVAPGPGAMAAPRVTPTGATRGRRRRPLRRRPRAAPRRRARRQLRDRGQPRRRPGPRRRAARGLEGLHEGRARDSGRPDGAARRLRRPGRGLAFVSSLEGPASIKTDGLAAGKGVLVTDDREEAAADLTSKLPARLRRRRSSRRVEEGLRGEECSLLVLVDGSTAVPMAPAHDHKRLRDGDRVRTPAAWARCRRSRASTTRSSRRSWTRPWSPLKELRARGHRVPRRALRGPHADRGDRACSSSTCAWATPRPR